MCNAAWAIRGADESSAWPGLAERLCVWQGRRACRTAWWPRRKPSRNHQVPWGRQRLCKGLRACSSGHAFELAYGLGDSNGMQAQLGLHGGCRKRPALENVVDLMRCMLCVCCPSTICLLLFVIKLKVKRIAYVMIL